MRVRSDSDLVGAMREMFGVFMEVDEPPELHRGPIGAIEARSVEVSADQLGESGEADDEQDEDREHRRNE